MKNQWTLAFSIAAACFSHSLLAGDLGITCTTNVVYKGVGEPGGPKAGVVEKFNLTETSREKFVAEDGVEITTIALSGKSTIFSLFANASVSTYVDPDTKKTMATSNLAMLPCDEKKMYCAYLGGSYFKTPVTDEAIVGSLNVFNSDRIVSTVSAEFESASLKCDFNP